MNINYNFRSPNYSARNGHITFIIIHFTEINFDESLARLCDRDAKVSAHYIIKADGEIFNLVDNQHCAWHAGLSYWKGLEKLNEYSIGIEIDNDGLSDFTKEQVASCISLCQHLKKLYNINSSDIIGHSDVAPDRKIDPGIFFDWEYLAEFDLGIWHNIDLSTVSDKVEAILEYGSTGSKIHDLQTDLRKLGYRVEITEVFDLQTNFAVRAFQSHFYPQLLRKFGSKFYWDQNSKYNWDLTSELILKNLVKKLGI